MKYLARVPLGARLALAAALIVLPLAFLVHVSVVGILLIVMVIAISLVSRQVTRPLRRLTGAARRVSAGEAVSIARTSPDPDVAELEDAFAKMSSEVSRREGQLREQAALLRLLDDAGAWIASGLDSSETAERVTLAAANLTDARAAVFLWARPDLQEHGYEVGSIAGSLGASLRDLIRTREAELVPSLLYGGRPVRIDDTATDPRFAFATSEGRLNNSPLPPVQSCLAVPVVNSRGLVGGLLLADPRPGHFTRRRERIGAGIASWAAIALENSRLYEDLTLAQESLLGSNRSKDEFLGFLSHELRTPTTTIYGGLKLLDGRRERMSDEAVSDLISSMADESARLVRLIENLLAIARLEVRDDEGLDLQPTDINDLVTSIVNRFQARNRGHDIQLDLCQGLPAVNLEMTYFEQILQNLLSNADKYSAAGEPIFVSTAPAGDEVRVSVSDRGKGVAAEELDAIFDSFFRADAVKSLKGQGLGLAVCRRLTEAQAGRIWAENRTGGGLTVALALPRAA